MDLSRIFGRLAFGLWAGLALLAGCAQEGSPGGGPTDEAGPELQWADPVPGTLNFEGNTLTLKFDEFVRVPQYNQNVFVSPLLENPPKIFTSGKRIKLRFREALRANTTYVISFTDIKDVNAGNSIEVPITLAFSTGPVIDSLEVRGRVEGITSGVAVENVSVLLFDADSIVAHDFFDKKPAYVTRTDAQGQFRLPYLRTQPYEIYGVLDQDQSNSYSLATEPVALADSSRVVFTAGDTLREVSLVVSLPDTVAPTPRAFRWLSDSVLQLPFSEGIRLDSLRAMLFDSALSQSRPLPFHTIHERTLTFSTLPFRRLERPLLQLENLTDSLGNARDTVVELRPRRVEKLESFPLLAPIAIAIDSGGYVWRMPVRWDSGQLATIQLRDTGDRPIRATVYRSGFRYRLRPDTALTVGLKYRIAIPGEGLGQPDTTWTFAVDPFLPTNYGRVSGVLELKNYDGPFVLRMTDGTNNYRTTRREFGFPRVPPGTYRFELLLDRDGNGVPTPGSLDPYRLPERILTATETVAVRANWEFDEVVVRIDAERPNAPVQPASEEKPPKN